MHTLTTRKETIVPCEDYNIFLRNLNVIIERSGIKEKQYFEHICEEVKGLDKKLHEQLKFFDEVEN